MLELWLVPRLVTVTVTLGQPRGRRAVSPPCLSSPVCVIPGFDVCPSLKVWRTLRGVILIISRFQGSFVSAPITWCFAVAADDLCPHCHDDSLHLHHWGSVVVLHHRGRYDDSIPARPAVFCLLL